MALYVFVTLLLVCSVASAQSPPAAQGDERMSDAVVLEGSDLPDSVRLSIFVSFLARLMRDDPEEASTYGQRFGVDGNSSAYLHLAELYGDFDRRQMETWSATMPELADEERPLFSRAMQEEKQTFLGSTMGSWFKTLESAGQDTKAFTRAILRDSSLEVSVGFAGEPVTPQDLQERAQRLERAFEAAFGDSLAVVVGDSE